MVTQWRSKSYTLNINDKLSNVKYNQGVYCIKYANILLHVEISVLST